MTQHPVHIGAAAPAAPLSPWQQQFNTQVQHIARLRERLAAWDEAAAAYRARYAAEYAPLLATHHALLRELAQWLDEEASPRKLSRADRATLGAVIADLADSLASSARDEATRAAMAALHQRYAAEPDLAGADDDSPEAIARRVEEQLRARQAQAEQARADRQAARRAKKSSARAQSLHASPPVRDIYRKLASALHPDRASDPAERARKTALMQRANQAYAASNLLDLLQLQLEAEQIDPARLADLGEERLGHYTQVLAGQRLELQREIDGAEAAFRDEFGLDPHGSPKPAQLMAGLRAHIRDLKAATPYLRQELRTLRDDPEALLPWLRAQRAALRDNAIH
ncbi:MAG: J domain-containing protein [Acidovorax sp.]